MSKIKIFIVDDSLVVRHVLTEIISAEADFELMGSASNGKIALEKLKDLAPDVVVLDIEMPEMDGLQTLPGIRKLHPRMPVIMCSTLTQKGAEATIEALSLGAVDYVAKPTNTASLANSKDVLKQELLPKLRSFGERYCQAKAAETTLFSAHQKTLNAPQTVFSSSKPTLKQQIDVVAIGVSTGGPNALEKVLSAIPANFTVPILVVQHMPPVFTKMLAEHLNHKCPLEVCEAQSGDVVTSGKIWIAPGGSHMAVARVGNQVKIVINNDPPENSCRPAVDVLFRSVNQIYGNHTLAVMMTGMGSDGLKGCELIHKSGGVIFAQDESSSVVWGMPGFVVKSGFAHAVLPLEQLAGGIVETTRLGLTSVFVKNAPTVRI